MVAGVLENLTEEEILVDAVFCTVGFNHLDIFGTYYILDTSNDGQNLSVKSSEEATTILQINDEGLRELHSEYLTNVSIDISYYYYKLLAFLKKIIGSTLFVYVRLPLAVFRQHGYNFLFFINTIFAHFPIS